MTERTPEEIERLFNEGVERRRVEEALIDSWRGDLPHWTPLAPPVGLCADDASRTERHLALARQRVVLDAGRTPDQS
jgi:hypothetical protein